MSGRRDAVAVTDDLLHGWPLPQPDSNGDKESRGGTLIIAGSREIPGAAMLSATAALRAGAGKLTLATAASVAPGIALALLESRVIALPESPGGGLAVPGVELLDEVLGNTRAVLVGPGMMDEAESCSFVQALLGRCDECAVVLDALAMGVTALQPRFDRPVLMTPHAGEMAHLTGASKDEVQDDPAGAARAAAMRWNAVVAVKGACTWIATPDGELWCHDDGTVGLATSGSGDVLAGIVTGLLARGAPLVQACVWGVALHARAGHALAARIGPLGFLASELAAEVPGLMHRHGDASR